MIGKLLGHALAETTTRYAHLSDEIVADALNQLAYYKAPGYVAFVDALPLSGAGKVLKTKLREPFWRGRERNVA